MNAGTRMRSDISSGRRRRRLARQVHEQLEVLFADVLLHEAAQRHGGALQRILDADLVGDQRLDAVVVGFLQHRPITKAVRNIASAMITEFGGAVAVPSAVRSSDSTTTMRVNDVIMIRIDGAIDSTVSSAISWIARSVTPPLPWPPRLMLMSCANAGSRQRSGGDQNEQEIKLYAGWSPISRRTLRTAEQRGHLVFQIFKAGLRAGAAGPAGPSKARCAAA